MATYRSGSGPAVRTLSVIFHPTEHGWTYAEVVTTDWRGARRATRRLGSCRLRVGHSDLVGASTSEVTMRLVDAMRDWLICERDGASYDALPTTPRPAAPAPPEGVTGAVLKGTVDNPLPGGYL